MTYDDYDRDILPHAVMLDYYRNRRDRKARREAERSVDDRWHSRVKKEFRYKIHKTTEFYQGRGIYEMDMLNKWLENCRLNRLFMTKGIEPRDNDLPYAERHRRTIKMIRSTRMSMPKNIPGTDPLGFRIDPCTKYIPVDEVDVEHSPLGVALTQGLLPKRLSINCTAREERMFRDIIAFEVKPKHMWSIARTSDEPHDPLLEDENIRKPTMIYFTADEDADEIIAKMWQVYEIRRVKRQLTA